MKVLRIYDHLGELKKEFNLYVEGEDFFWQASYPEVVWLGRIVLEDAGKEPEAEPTPEPEAVKYEPEALQLSRKEFLELPNHSEVTVKEKTESEVKDAPEKSDRKRSRVKRSTPSTSPESTKRLHQEDSPRDFIKGDTGHNLG